MHEYNWLEGIGIAFLSVLLFTAAYLLLLSGQ